MGRPSLKMIAWSPIVAGPNTKPGVDAFKDPVAQLLLSVIDDDLSYRLVCDGADPVGDLGQ
jgi:hypothetical protein